MTQNLIKTKELLILLSSAVFTLATMYAPQPLLSAIQDSYPAYSDADIALFMTLVLCPLSIAPLLYGIVLSLFSTKRILLFSVAILCVTSLGLYLVSNFSLIIFFRFIQGLVVPAMLPSLMAYLSMQYSGAILQQVMANYIAATILGGLIGRICSGFITSIFHWQMPFLFLAIGLAILFIFLLHLPEHSENTFKHFSLNEFNQIIHIKGVKRLLFIESSCFFVFIALATYLPFLLTHIDNNISEGRIGLTYLGYGVGIFIALKSRSIINLVGDSVKTMRLGIFIFGISLLLFLIPNITCIFLAMFLLCSGQFLEHSINPGLINRICPYNKNTLNCLYVSFYYMGGALGSYFPGIIYEKFGWNIFIFFLSTVLLCSLIATYHLKKHTPK